MQAYYNAFMCIPRGKADASTQEIIQSLFVSASEIVILMHQVYGSLQSELIEHARAWVRSFRKRVFFFLRELWSSLGKRGLEWPSGLLLWGMVCALSEEYELADRVIKTALSLHGLSPNATEVAHVVAWICCAEMGLETGGVLTANAHLREIAALCTVKRGQNRMGQDRRSCSAGAGAGSSVDVDVTAEEEGVFLQSARYSLSMDFYGFLDTQQTTLFMLNAFVYSAIVAEGNIHEKTLNITEALLDWLCTIRCNPVILNDVIMSLVKLGEGETAVSPKALKCAAVLLALMLFRDKAFTGHVEFVMQMPTGIVGGIIRQLFITGGIPLPVMCHRCTPYTLIPLTAPEASLIFSTYSRIVYTKAAVRPAVVEHEAESFTVERESRTATEVVRECVVAVAKT
jgi:hypothetical protein